MSGADAVPADILVNDEGTTVFQFRSGATDNGLRSFFIKTGGANSQNSGPLHIDDLYLENTDYLKLDNPTACKGDFDEDRDVDGNGGCDANSEGPQAGHGYGGADEAPVYGPCTDAGPGDCDGGLL